jgi:hypothetical protein
MLRWLLNDLKARVLTLSGQSGFVSSGPGMASSEDGVVSIFVGTLLGALFGLLGGFILSHLLRFMSFLTGRHLGGFSWVLIGALAGAAIFGCLAAWRDDG